MRILLVNPAFPPSLWDFARCRDLDGSLYAHPPLSLPTLAALTPGAHEVRLLDENVEPFDLGLPADVVGISGYWMQRDRVFALADALRARGRQVAIGGPIVEQSSLAECAEHADSVFWGEAEHTWPRFLEELAAGRPAPLYHQQELVDLRCSPTPRFELLRRRAYTTATIETSRGCPMACEFCEIPARLGRRPRTKTPAQVLAEVRALHRLGAESIFIVDDNLVGQREHARRVLEELARFSRATRHRIAFSCQITIDVAEDDRFLELLRDANIRRVFVGLETPRRQSLVEAGKRQNLVGDMVRAVHRLQSRNITVWAAMIVGFDHDDPAVFDEHRRFLEEAGVPVVMSGLLQAIPGTPLHERLARAGRLREMELAGVRGRIEAALATNIVPCAMSDEELAGGFQRMVRELYDYEPFARRLLASLRRGEPRPGGWPSLSPRLLAILTRLLRHYLLTRDSRRRRMFWRVLLGTLRHRPQELKTALFHLVVYKHLRAFHEQLAELPLPRLERRGPP